jgi:chromosome segregation protein
MRLESVSLHGFKSFGERVVVKVLGGITAVVGPNGCGKSNISDAVRWALGEQSAKSLRGHQMADLIFHGSASRKPVGLAEVELVFSNDGTLSVPWAEVAVARRLYRTGESEYLLNKSVCRLRDILDLFAGTGASPRAYSVMDQDKLNHVLTAKPFERRIFIEEAAGIARYKQQRNETQGKLDAARHNLLRVKDVMDEVRRQLGSLERQAKKAQQYKALEGERRDLTLVLLAADFADLTAEVAQLDAELRGQRDAEHRLRSLTAQVSAREANGREAVQRSDHRLSDLRQAVQKVQADFERLLERREQMSAQLRDAGEEDVRLHDELRAGAERLAAILDDRKATAARLAEAEQLQIDRGRATADADAALAHERADLGGHRDRLEALRLAQVRIASERIDLIRSAGELRERRSQLARRSERLTAELAGVEAEAARLTAERASLEMVRDRAVAELSTLGAERARLHADQAEREQGLATAEAELADLRLTLAARPSSLDAVRQLAAAREGYGAGVRAVLASEARAAGLAGVIGTVADLLDVPPELERAVEAVLGERLEWVVVECFEHARAGVNYLQSRRLGAATFVPLEHLPGEPERHRDNGVRWIAGRVHAPSASLVHYLLGQVAVVDHLDQAETLWRRNGVVATYVTIAGEVLGPQGRLFGGDRDDGAAAGASLLGRKRRLRELTEEVADLVARVDTAQESIAQATTEVAAVRDRLVLLNHSIQTSEVARLAGDKDLEQAARELERIHRHRETIAVECRQVEGEADQTARTLTTLEQSIAIAQEAEAAQEATIGALRETIEAAQARESALLAALTACRVEVASAAERVEALGRDLARLDEMEAELRSRLGQGHRRQEQLGERRQWLGEERERTDAQAHEVAVERDRLDAEMRRATESHEALLASLRSVEAERRDAESEVRRLTEAAHAIELRVTERRVRREELGQEALRAHGIDAAALLARHAADRDLTGVRDRIGELATKLAAIGPVNLVADEEYRELDERGSFLRTQHDDLTASIRDLDRALRGMTRTAQERFTQAFSEINERFGAIFERLFEGGRAELRLVEAEEGGDPLETGVELMAQPRGKRLQAVTLMSGGERALTGLALLFAIFYFRPSPFCVLDEVDAPLDDANIHRFLRVLRELTGQTQFVVITHNRKTMEAADVLYGVTMEEPGLSKLVAVKLAD